jgi:alpha-L-fucosidase
VPITPEGDLEPACLKMLKDMGEWMKVNGEGIYGSKAWKTWGEGELITDPKKPEKAPALRVFPGGGLSKYHANFKYETSDFRFTEGKNGEIYAWCMTAPTAGSKILVKSFGKESDLLTKKIKSVQLLGCKQKLKWEQTAAALVVTYPEKMDLHYAVGFKVILMK